MEPEEENRKTFFADQFSRRLDYWTTINKKNQEDFRIEAGISSRNTITNWKQGKTMPREEQLHQISQVLKCEEEVFAPYFDTEKDIVTNCQTEARSKELESYAQMKGLRDRHYQHMIHLPFFLSRFPFHGISGSYGIRYYLFTGKKKAKKYPLVKYQMEDGCGHRFMLDEQDIDFMITLDGKDERNIEYHCYKEKERLRKANIENLIRSQLPYFKGITYEEVLERVNATNIMNLQEAIDHQRVTSAIYDLAQEKGIKPSISRQEIQAREYSRQMPMKEAAEWYSLNGMTGDEIRLQRIRDEEKIEAKVEKKITYYRKRGYTVN